MLRLPEFLAMRLIETPFVENVVIVSVFRFFFLCKDFHNIVNEVTIRLNRSVPTEIEGWNLLNIKDSLE